MTTNKNLKKLQKLYDEGKLVLSTKFNDSSYGEFVIILEDEVDSEKFEKWKSSCIIVLEQLLNHESTILENFKNDVKLPRYNDALKGVSILESLIENYDLYIVDKTNTQTIENDIENIFNKFHNVAKQLTYRRENRKTIEINDEYDVQDLLHSLLYIPFNDIRPEEWTPSYGGKSSRMDFLIKDENIVIETKMTRKNLRDKRLIEELIIDTTHYSKHPDCEMLYCFVYDKNELIRNPKAIENDLSGMKDGLEVKVIIRPER